MSETVTEESVYPALSEATENDIRETSQEIAENPDPPQPVETEEKAPEPVEPHPEDDLSARNARLARELREQKRIARQLEQYNQHLQGQRQVPQDEATQYEINMRAQQLAQQQTVNQKSQEIFDAGVKQYGQNEFQQSVAALNDSFGQQQMPVVIDTIVDLPDAQKLIQHLADNPDIADHLAALPPHKLGAALARESSKINTPKQRAVSKAPPPIRPIATQATSEPEMDLDRMTMDQLAKMWDKRDFQKRFG